MCSRNVCRYMHIVYIPRYFSHPPFLPLWRERVRRPFGGLIGCGADAAALPLLLSFLFFFPPCFLVVLYLFSLVACCAFLLFFFPQRLR